jgi:transcriptional regulator with PAS, ATPase and Fis domain
LRRGAGDLARVRAVRLHARRVHRRGGPKLGLFEEADGGTLFLDEIAEMPPALQVKLLRALQSGEVRRLGATQSTTIDVRVIAATHGDLSALLAQGPFARISSTG